MYSPIIIKYYIVYYDIKNTMITYINELILINVLIQTSVTENLKIK
jgi:hypothetical protein